MLNTCTVFQFCISHEYLLFCMYISLVYIHSKY